MKNYILLILGVVAIVALARLTCYTVDAAEYTYVTVLGEHRDTFDGADRDGGAGLKVGWPWPIQQVQRLDRRLQQFDLLPFEQLTHDPEGNTVDKILLVEAYVCWKIADAQGANQFMLRIGAVAKTRDILGPEITSKLGGAIGKRRMDDFVNTTVDKKTGRTKVDVTLDSLRQEVLAGLKEHIRTEYGIDLVDIRLRRFNHPASVRDSIFERIKSERSKEAQKYKSDGEFAAANILSKADEKVRTDLAKARIEEETIKTSADLKANEIRNRAYSQDPEFYAFLKNMESMQAVLGGDKTMLLLSAERFKAFFKEPRAVEKNKKSEK